MRRGPAVRLPPAAWSGTGPWPARVGGTGALRRNGDLFAKAYERVAGGLLGLFARASYLFSPLPLPSPWSVLFPAPIPGGALEPKAEGGGSPVPDGTAKDSGSRACAAARQGDLAGGGTGADPHHHIDGRCHMDLCKMLGTLDPDVHRLGARLRGVRRWARTAGGRRATRPGRVSTRTRPAAGARCRRVGQRQRRRARISARRAPGPTPGGTPPVRAGIVSRAWRPAVAGRRCCS